MPTFSTSHALQFGSNNPTVSIYGTDASGYISIQLSGTFYQFASNTKYLLLQIIFNNAYSTAPYSVTLTPANSETEKALTAQPSISFFIDGGNYPGATNSDITNTYFKISGLSNHTSLLGPVTLTFHYQVNANKISSLDGTQSIAVANSGVSIAGKFIIDGYQIDPSGAITNQVLKYNGSKFIPSTDDSGSIPLSNTSPQPVGLLAAAGISSSVSRDDHVHPAVIIEWADGTPFGPIDTKIRAARAAFKPVVLQCVGYNYNIPAGAYPYFNEITVTDGSTGFGSPWGSGAYILCAPGVILTPSSGFLTLDFTGINFEASTSLTPAGTEVFLILVRSAIVSQSNAALFPACASYNYAALRDSSLVIGSGKAPVVELASGAQFYVDAFGNSGINAGSVGGAGTIFLACDPQTAYRFGTPAGSTVYSSKYPSTPLTAGLTSQGGPPGTIGINDTTKKAQLADSNGVFHDIAVSGTGWFDVRDYGAVGDFDLITSTAHTDDSAAFLACLKAATDWTSAFAQRFGVVYIPPCAKGKGYGITAGVTLAFTQSGPGTGGSLHLDILGCGADGPIVCNTGTGVDVINLSFVGMEWLMMSARKLAFVTSHLSTPSVGIDCRSAFVVDAAVGKIIIDEFHNIGVRSDTAATGGTFRFQGANFEIGTIHNAGGTSYASDANFLHLDQVSVCTIRSLFDYSEYLYQGVDYAGGIHNNLIRVTPSRDASWGPTILTIENLHNSTRIDYPIYCYQLSGSTRAASITVKNFKANATGTGYGFISHCDYIELAKGAWSAGASKKIVDAYNFKKLVLRDIQVSPGSVAPDVRQDGGGVVEAIDVVIGTATMNGGAIFTTVAGHTTGSGIFNIVTFGAKGDALTDDTAAIQAAMLAALSTGGGVVYFPGGTYRMRGSTTLTTSGGNPSLVFMGPGGAAAKILVDGDSTTVPFTLIESSAQSATFEFRDLSFRAPPGNSAGVTRNALSVIVMTSASTDAMQTIRRCTFDGIWTDSDMVQWNNAYALAEDVGIYACSSYISGVNVYSAMLSFQQCYRASARRVIGLDVSSTGLASNGASQYGIYFVSPAASGTYPAPLGDFVADDCIVDENFGINQIQFGAGTFPIGTKWATASARNIFGNVGGASNSNMISAVNGAKLRIENVQGSFYGGSKQTFTVNGVDQVRIEGAISKSGLAEIVIDNPTYVPTFIPVSKSVEIVDSNFTKYTTPAAPVAVFVTENGIRSRLRLADGAVLAHTLAKLSTSVAGRAAQFLKTDTAGLITGSFLDGGADGAAVRVVEEPGQVVPLKSDGVGVIAIGADIDPSTTQDGRVVAGTGIIGRNAGPAVAATLDALVDVL